MKKLLFLLLVPWTVSAQPNQGGGPFPAPQVNGVPIVASPFTTNAIPSNGNISGAFTNLQVVEPTTQAVTSSVGVGNISGVADYEITFQTVQGETYVGPPTDDGDYGGDIIQLSSIPISLDIAVTSKNVYRLSAIDLLYHFLTNIPNSITVITDNVPDASLSARVAPYVNTSGGFQFIGGVRQPALLQDRVSAAYKRFMGPNGAWFITLRQDGTIIYIGDPSTNEADSMQVRVEPMVDISERTRFTMVWGGNNAYTYTFYTNAWYIGSNPNKWRWFGWTNRDIYFGATNGSVGIGTNFSTGTLTNALEVFGNATITGSLYVGWQNTAAFTPIQTNFISGTIYSNFYGAPIEVSTTAILTVTTVAGDATLEARAISNATNRYTIQTIVGTLGTTNGSYLAVKVPINGTYTFTNTSAGSGDSATCLGGQIFIY